MSTESVPSSVAACALEAVRADLPVREHIAALTACLRECPDDAGIVMRQFFDRYQPQLSMCLHCSDMDSEELCAALVCELQRRAEKALPVKTQDRAKKMMWYCASCGDCTFGALPREIIHIVHEWMDVIEYEPVISALRCCFILARRCANERMLGSLESLRSITMTLTSHSSPLVCHAACTALVNVLYSHKARTNLMSVDGHRALMAVLRKHIGQEHVVIRAVMALNNLTGGFQEFVLQQLLDDGLISLLCRASHLHSESATLHRSLTHYLYVMQKEQSVDGPLWTDECWAVVYRMLCLACDEDGCVQVYQILHETIRKRDKEEQAKDFRAMQEHGVIEKLMELKETEPARRVICEPLFKTLAWKNFSAQ